MSEWNFWAWLTYACISVAAIMIAVDQGARRLKASTEGFGTLLRSPLWAFTPFVLILASGIILGVRAFNSSTQAPAPTMETPATVESVSQPQVSVPSDLRKLTNDDLRSVAYMLNGKIDLLLGYYYEEDVKVYKLSANERASARLRLDAELNRQFRGKYVGDVLRVESELRRRLKSGEETTQFPDGILSAGAIGVAADLLIKLARELP